MSGPSNTSVQTVLNPPNNLNTVRTLDYTQGKLQDPTVVGQSRFLPPSYAKTSLAVGQSESIQITATVDDALQHGTGGTGKAAGSQQFSALNSVKLTPWDTGQIHFTNISVEPAASGQNVIFGAPQLLLVDGAGRTYPAGMLVPGQNHQGLSIQASIPAYTPDGTAPATVTVTATGILMGTSTQH